GSGHDTITGGNDGDVIIGGVESGQLTGACGHDTFRDLDARDGEGLITHFRPIAASGSEEDKIDLDAFNFSGTAIANIKETSPASFTTGDTTDFFDAAGTDRAVVVEYNGGDAQVFVDVDKDGNFSTDFDLVIRLDNVTANSLAVGDFVF